ncbi:MAG: hypothetical protein ABW212_07590, partial [Pseudonocardia sediminis]
TGDLAVLAGRQVAELAARYESRTHELRGVAMVVQATAAGVRDLARAAAQGSDPVRVAADAAALAELTTQASEVVALGVQAARAAAAELSAAVADLAELLADGQDHRVPGVQDLADRVGTVTELREVAASTASLAWEAALVLDGVLDAPRADR